MPKFEITSPDGKTFEVEGPDGSTKEQALEKVKAQHGSAAPTEQRSAVGDFFKSIPGGIVKGFSAAGSAAGQAAAIEMNQPQMAAEFPTPEQMSESLQKNVTGELPKPQGRAGRYGETVGEFLGSPATYVGPGGLPLKVGGAVASALASEGAGQLTEGTSFEPWARAGAGIGAGVGVGVASAERSLSKLAAELPTIDKIKSAAQAGYKQLEASGTKISPDGTAALQADIQSALMADQFRDYLAPNTFKAIEELGVKGAATIGDIDGVRRLLGRVPVTNPTDRLAADRAIDAIDNWLINVPVSHVISGDPALDAAILKHAQGNWAAYKQLQTLEKSTTQAQHRAGVSGSGANSINTARQEVRKILDSDKKSRGLSEAAKEKMEEIVMGTWATNSARTVGKFAPSGPVSATASILTGIGAGAPVGAAVGIGGLLAKHLGEYLTDRQIGQLEQLLRAQSPIGKPIAAANAPAVADAKMIAPAQALRSTLATGGALAGSGP